LSRILLLLWHSGLAQEIVVHVRTKAIARRILDIKLHFEYKRSLLQCIMQDMNCVCKFISIIVLDLRWISWKIMIIKQAKVNILEAAIVLFLTLHVLGVCIDYYDIIIQDLSYHNPFFNYHTNPGIVILSLAFILSGLSFIICFILSCYKKRQTLALMRLYLISALIIAFIQWYELYYGSTFYYGEVRDKQGLMFPVLASLMVTLVIWKTNFNWSANINYRAKVMLAVFLNCGLTVLWKFVEEPWRLYSS
jgi:hypothetical protein